MLAQWEGKQWETLREQLWLQLRGVGGVAMADGSGVCPFASIKSAKSLDCPSHTYHRHRRWHTHTHTHTTEISHTHIHRDAHTHTQTAPTHAHQIWKGKKINPKKRKKQQNKKLNTQKKCRYEAKKVKNVAQGKRGRQCWRGEKEYEREVSGNWSWSWENLQTFA